jgi:hypothetical protein
MPTLTAIPVILACNRQNDVAKRQLCLGVIAPDKVRVFIGEIAPMKFFRAEKQAAAPVHEQSRGFAGRKFFRVAQMLASGQSAGFTNQRPIAHQQIVIKHARGTLLKLSCRRQCQFHVDAGFIGKLTAEAMQRMMVAAAIEQVTALQTNVKFQIIVGLVAVFGSQHPSLTAPVASAQQQGLQPPTRNDRAHSIAHLVADLRETIFQRFGSVDGESRFHAV